MTTLNVHVFLRIRSELIVPFLRIAHVFQVEYTLLGRTLNHIGMNHVWPASVTQHRM